MRMFSTKPNKNGCVVTDAFIDQIVANSDKYVCIPLCVDTKRLKNGDTKHLGHMLDKRTGQFLSEQIGAFSHFEKVADEYGVSLIGEARIAKRNKKVCAAIQSLYEAQQLNFSFEILAQEVTEQEGIKVIDAAEGNELIGMAVVSIPAYPEATALALVAEAAEDNRASEMLVHTAFEMAEIDFETIRHWFFKALRLALDDALWDYKIERLGMDFAILYSMSYGRTLKVEFIANEDGVSIVDVYEVQYTRIEQEENGGMNMSEKEMQAQLEAAQGEVRELKKQIADKDEMAAGRDAKIAEQEEKLAEAEKARAELFAQVQALLPIQEEAAGLRARLEAAEQEEKRKQLHAFAEAHGLSVEEPAVAEAIERLDAAALMSESIKAKGIQDAKPVMAVHALTAGIQTEKYGGLLAAQE